MKDITFKYPENFIFFIVPVILLLLMILGLRKKVKILKQLGVDRKIMAVKRQTFRIILMFISICAIFFALLGPQNLDGEIEVSYESLDIFVLMDASNSMLVEDVTPNRLEKEKYVVNKLISQLKGERIGFVPFSSSAYVQMPLTNDYNLAKMYLEVVDTTISSGGGSDIGKAIKAAYEAFDKTSVGDKVILIISDGEEKDSKAVEILKEINDDQLMVYTMGVGTTNGGPVPIYYEYIDEISGYVKDRNGNQVISKLDDSKLIELAELGNGEYYHIDNTDRAINSFLMDLNKLSKNEVKTKTIKNYNHLYQYFLGGGMLLFLIAYLLPIRRRKQ